LFSCFFSYFRKQGGSTVSNLIFENFNYWWISIRAGSTWKHHRFFLCYLCIDDVLANFNSKLSPKVAPRWEFNSQQFQQMSIKFSFILLDLLWIILCQTSVVGVVVYYGRIAHHQTLFCIFSFLNQIEQF